MKHKSKHHRLAFWLLILLAGWRGLKSSADSYGPSPESELLRTHVVFSTNKNLIAVTGKDGVELWDARSKQKKRTVMQSSAVGNRAVNALAFSPDNRLIACGRPDETALLWDVATGQWTRPLGNYGGLVTALAFSPNGRVLVGGSYTSVDVTPESEKPKASEYRRFPPSFYRRYKYSGDITIRDAQTNELKWTVKWDNATLSSLAFSPDGRNAAALANGKVRIYNARTGQLQRELGTSFSNLCDITFSPNGKMIAGSNDKGSVVIHETQSGILRHTLPPHNTTLGSIYSVSFSPNSQLVASAGSGENIYISDTRSGKLKHTLVGLDLTLERDRDDAIKDRYGSTAMRAATFSSNGREIIAVGFGYNHFGGAPLNMAIQRWSIKK